MHPLGELGAGAGRHDRAVDLLRRDAAQRIDDVVVIPLDLVCDRRSSSRFREPT